MQRIKKNLRLGLLSLIGYELVLRNPLGQKFQDLIGVIVNQRIALCHSLINASHGGLRGTEEVCPVEFAVRAAWIDAIDVSESGDEQALATELEYVETLHELISVNDADEQEDNSDHSLDEIASAAHGCREVWSSIAKLGRRSRRRKRTS